MPPRPEAGNAMIYVLIAVVLFGALSFVLSRQVQTGQTSALSEENAKIYATQIMNYAAQAKSAVDQMTYTGTSLSEVDFTRPGAATFETDPVIHKVYHPQGGGLSPGVLASGSIHDSAGDAQTPGWYMGRFSTVEWSPTSAQDIILTAYKIDPAICEQINLHLTGTGDIPQATVAGGLFRLLIDPALHGAGAAVDFTTTQCPDCEGKASLCVERGGVYAFYSIIGGQ